MSKIGMLLSMVATGVLAGEGYNPGSFFQSKTVIIPHDDKLHRGGEDSADSSDTVLVVADGVGGWSLRGINPGLFSQALTRSIVDFHEEDSSWSAGRLLFEGCKKAGSELQGSATVVTLKLLENLGLEGANLGDSGYTLFHVNEDDTLEQYFRSPTQQKTHNFPYQCGGEQGGDDPRDAEIFHHDDVRDGDVVLVFSDGFHDNIFDSGMPQCIEEHLYDGLVTSLSEAADCLARKAYYLGKNPEFQSPWMKEFKHYMDNGIPVVNEPPPNFPFIGGKADDITITLAQIFTDKGSDDPRRQLSANDKFFEEQKHLYTSYVPLNSHDQILRARFTDRNAVYKHTIHDESTEESTEDFTD